jgi:hypothetical protein
MWYFEPPYNYIIIDLPKGFESSRYVAYILRSEGADCRNVDVLGGLAGSVDSA